jgi:UMF1 family MFS transporter
MCVYGIIDQVTGSPRYSILFLCLFFVTGIILLSRVRKIT